MIDFGQRSWRRAGHAVLVALRALLGLAAPAAWADINFGDKTIPALSFGVIGSGGTCANFNIQVTLPHASGVGDLNYSISPALPAGLTFAVVDGQIHAATISGNPTAATAKATYTYTYTATEGDPPARRPRPVRQPYRHSHLYAGSGGRAGGVGGPLHRHRRGQLGEQNQLVR